MSALESVLSIDELAVLIMRNVCRKSLANLACVNKPWFDLAVPELWQLVTNPSLDDLQVHLQDSENLDFYLGCTDGIRIVVQEEPNGLRIPQCLPVQLSNIAYLEIDCRKTNGAHQHEIKWVARKIKSSISRPLTEITVCKNGGEIVQAMGYEVFDNAVMGITLEAGFSKGLFFAAVVQNKTLKSSTIRNKAKPLTELGEFPAEL